VALVFSAASDSAAPASAWECDNGIKAPLCPGSSFEYSFWSIKGYTCNLGLQGFTTPDPADPTIESKTSVHFLGWLSCGGNMKSMYGQLSATDPVTHARYVASPNPFSCSAPGCDWPNNSLDASGDTGFIAPTVLELTVSNLRVVSPDPDDLWYVIPTPAEGATCVPSGPTISCSTIVKRWWTGREAADVH
jgi:hypothetical protein